MHNTSRASGFGLIEIVIASAIVSVVTVSLAYVFILSSRINDQTTERARAHFLAEEGLEVVRYMRDKGWATNIQPLEMSTPYYLVFTAASSQWSLTTDVQPTIDNTFSRTIVFSPVSRDGLYDIVLSGGTNDPDTLKVVSSVTWGGSNTVQLPTYITNMFSN
jgi:prepilin-type N-terminal cleavage/methylation domain-containing protein